MTKKDFIALADLIRAGYKSGNPLMFFSRDQINALADFCKTQSSGQGYKRERWIAYIDGECGPNGGSVK